MLRRTRSFRSGRGRRDRNDGWASGFQAGAISAGAALRFALCRTHLFTRARDFLASRYPPRDNHVMRNTRHVVEAEKGEGPSHYSDPRAGVGHSCRQSEARSRDDRRHRQPLRGPAGSGNPLQRDRPPGAAGLDRAASPGGASTTLPITADGLEFCVRS
jgi:hypothetical protein